MNNSRGKYVSRAAFAKMQADRDRMKKDLYLITMGGKEKGLEVFRKWKQKFLEQQYLNDMLKEYALKELPKMAEKYPFLKELLNSDRNDETSVATGAQ